MEKAIDILDLISDAPQGLSQNELAERLGLPRTTLYRILATLIARGLVRRDPGRRLYCLGFRCLEMARQVYALPDLVSAAAAELRNLRDLTGETSYVGVLEGLDVISLERFDSPHSMRSNASMGHRKPIYATSQGKAILSALPEHERDAMIREVSLKALTPLTITDRRRLQSELRIIQRRGYAIDDEENVLGTRCVGAPVVDMDGVVRGAISVAGPAYRLPLARIELLGPELAEAARHIGSQLHSSKASASESAVTALEQVPKSIHASQPLWDSRTQTLCWLDTLAPAYRTWQPQAGPTRVMMAEPIIAMFTWEHTPVLVLENTAFALEGAEPRPLPMWLHKHVRAICNRSASTLWMSVGTGQQSRIGIVERDGTFESIWQLAEPVDHLLWHEESGTLYANAPQSGSLLMLKPGNQAIRKFATVPRSSGILSGLAVDAKGGLWTALREGWSVVHFSQDGVLDNTIPLPLPCPTGVAIAGDAGETLYVTSSRHDIALDILKKAPLSGSILQIDL
nr:IclR family transcriptional regulator C-terminal domain-containing protein [Pantoea sp. Ap-967]